MRCVRILMVLATLTGCGESLRQSDANSVTAARETFRAPTPAASDAKDKFGEHSGRKMENRTEVADEDGRSRMRDCYLKVDGTVHVAGRCLVFPMGDDTYTLNTWDRGKPASSHFAMISRRPDGSHEATWNADPDDTRAFDALGTVTLNDGCWTNDRVRICAR